jgi:hypothetical protein
MDHEQQVISHRRRRLHTLSGVLAPRRAPHAPPVDLRCLADDELAWLEARARAVDPALARAIGWGELIAGLDQAGWDQAAAILRKLEAARA